MLIVRVVDLRVFVILCWLGLCFVLVILFCGWLEFVCLYCGSVFFVVWLFVDLCF